MPGYNKKGRGIPDVAIQGFFYLVFNGKSMTLSSGTSAAAPAMAGMISNLNAARMRIGKGSVGFINPALYAYSNEFANDVTSGNNKCIQSGRCCKQGFYATPGWDPASGLGSLNYAKLEAVFLTLGKEANAAASFPTAVPTNRPTNVPTMNPTSEPSKPTFTPSFNPTKPTAGPTATPTSSPSAKPTPKLSSMPSKLTSSPSPSPSAAITAPSSSMPSTLISSPSLSPSALPTAASSSMSSTLAAPTSSPSLTSGVIFVYY